MTYAEIVLDSNLSGMLQKYTVNVELYRTRVEESAQADVTSKFDGVSNFAEDASDKLVNEQIETNEVSGSDGQEEEEVVTESGTEIEEEGDQID